MKSSEFEKHLASLGIVSLPEFKTTNSDRIRWMPENKLAEYLCSSSKFCSEDCKGRINDPNNPCNGRCDEKCYEHCIEWLNNIGK